MNIINEEKHLTNCGCFVVWNDNDGHAMMIFQARTSFDQGQNGQNRKRMMQLKIDDKKTLGV